MTEDTKSFVHIYTAPNDALFALAKSLLDNAEIEYYTKGTNLSFAYGGPLIIETSSENADAAREILKDMITGNPEVPETDYNKMISEQNNQSRFTLAIWIILFIIFLILLAVIFVRC